MEFYITFCKKTCNKVLSIELKLAGNILDTIINLNAEHDNFRKSETDFIYVSFQRQEFHLSVREDLRKKK